MKDILVTSFSKLSRLKFGQRAHSILSGMDGNTIFPEPFWDDPADTPTIASLTTDIGDLDDLMERVEDGDKTAKLNYEAKRESLTADFQKLAVYLELEAEGDRAKLETTGYALRKLPTHTGGPGPLPAPQSPKVVRGGVAGLLIARAKSVKGAGAYETQLCTGDDTVEANWHQVAMTKGCSRVEVDGQTPGVLCKVRIRAIGKTGPGTWSDIVSVRAD